MALALNGIALITGAGSGIGKNIAFAFARHAVKAMALLDLNPKTLEATRAELGAHHPNLDVRTFEADISHESSVKDAINNTVQRFGRIDLAVNCAGIGSRYAHTHELPIEEWQKMVSINQTGAWICQKYLIQQMLKQEPLGPRQGRGTIVNVASMYGITAPPADMPLTPYTATKHAVVGFTKADAKAYAPKGIRINAICPGYVETPLIKDAMEAGIMKAEFERTPMGRPGKVEEIADAVVFLASPMSSYMCGASLVVDGGYSI